MGILAVGSAVNRTLPTGGQTKCAGVREESLAILADGREDKTKSDIYGGLKMKATVLAILGAGDGWAKVWAVFAAIGGVLSVALGGWDAGVIALVIAMGVDFLLGVALGVFGKSPKTATGKLSSNAMGLGFIKKVCELVVIWLCVVIEPVLNVEFLRDAAVTGYLATEFLSILENMSLLGVPGLSIIKKVLDLLQTKKDNTTTGGDAK